MWNTQGESDCCWAPVYDPGNTGEGVCTECKEHCGYLTDDEKTEADS